MSFRLALGGPLRDCGAFVLWELPLGATNELQAGVSERVWVVEADGQPLIVLATDAGNATASQRQGIQQALDSIEFDTGS